MKVLMTRAQFNNFKILDTGQQQTMQHQCYSLICTCIIIFDFHYWTFANIRPALFARTSQPRQLWNHMQQLMQHQFSIRLLHEAVQACSRQVNSPQSCKMSSTSNYKFRANTVGLSKSPIFFDPLTSDKHEGI